MKQRIVCLGCAFNAAPYEIYGLERKQLAAIVEEGNAFDPFEINGNVGNCAWSLERKYDNGRFEIAMIKTLESSSEMLDKTLNDLMLWEKFDISDRDLEIILNHYDSASEFLAPCNLENIPEQFRDFRDYLTLYSEEFIVKYQGVRSDADFTEILRNVRELDEHINKLLNLLRDIMDREATNYLKENGKLK